MSSNGNESEGVESEVAGNLGDRIRLQQQHQQESRISSDESAMLGVQIATAKRYPRSVAQFRRDAMSMATLDEETAQSCFYSLPRGGKPIEGESIRLAEICATAWGHINAQSAVHEIGQVYVIARAVAWDMQSNLRIGVEVRRRITGKNGQRFNDDMIAVTSNAATAIALRNAILKVIPRTYVSQIYREARKVAVGDQKTLASRRASMIEYFGKLGVVEARVLAAVEVKAVDDIDLDKLATLKGFATAIKDGEATIEACFAEPAKDDAKKPTLADRVRGGGVKAEQPESQKPGSPLAAHPYKIAEIERECVRLGLAAPSERTRIGIKSWTELLATDADALLAGYRNRQPKELPASPPKTLAIHADVEEEFARIGTSPAGVIEMLKPHKVKRIADLPEVASNMLLADLRKLPDGTTEE